MRKRLTALLLALVMCLSLVPTVAFADGHDGQVRVIVENTTFTEATEDSEGVEPAWSDTLVDTWVAIDNDSTMMSCVVAALTAKGYTQEGAENNYISEINGLSEYDGGAASGWMGTLNDWFTNEGFGAFTAANGKLSAGDEIRMMYSLNYGEDCGGSWSNNDKTVSSVTFSAGTLNTTFDKNTHDYTLTVPAGTTAVTVTPTASNKNFQVRTSVNGTEYKRTAAVPVKNGTVITVKCGDPAWPSMNNGAYGGAENVSAQTYTFTVSKPVPAESIALNKSELTLDEGDSETLTATVTPDGATDTVAWSSSDAAVAAVDDTGKVTAVAVGTATITATAGEKTAACAVTVKQPTGNTVTVNVAPKTVDVTFCSDASASTPLPAERVKDNGIIKINNKDFHQYTLALSDTPEENTICYRGTDDTADMGIGVLKLEESTPTYTLARHNFYATAAKGMEDWTLKDFTDKTDSVAYTLGAKFNDNGTAKQLGLLIAGHKYGGTLEISTDLENDYYPGIFADFTVSTNVSAAVNKTLPVNAYKTFTLNVPSDAESVEFFEQTANFVVKAMDTAEMTTTNNGDGTTTYQFKSQNTNYAFQHMWRVSKAGATTLAGYMQNGKTITVTWPEQAPATTANAPVSSAFNYDDNSVLLNIDDSKDTNELAMQVGETFKLRAFRNGWEIISDVSGNKMIEPDFHYSILSGNDVISVAPVTDQLTGNAKDNWMNITALKEGTAVVAVWYDAIYISGSAQFDGFYGATDPARYGYVVVNVGADSTVAITPVSADGDWDAEFDTVYYAGDEGGTFSFASDDATSVTVTNLCGATMGTAKTVTKTDNKWNVPVYNGSNLITITSASGTDYRLVRAKKVNAIITNITTGKKSTDEGFAITVGDTVSVSLDKLDMPLPKMSGIYNPGFGGTCKMVYQIDGKYTQVSKGTQYNFPTPALCTVTFVASQAGDIHLGNGYITTGVFGSAPGAHRGLTDAGKPVNTNAPEASYCFGKLPELTLHVEDGALNYADMTELSSFNLHVGMFTGMSTTKYVEFKTAADAVGVWKSNTNTRAYLSITATPKTYYNTMSLTYWYDGESATTVDVPANNELRIPVGDQWSVHSDKILNLVFTITPGDGNTAEAKSYTFVVVTSNQDKTALENVIFAINSIGEVTLASNEKIAATRTAYDALTDELKAKVSNYSVLTDAESAYANIVRTKANDIYEAVGDSLLANAEKSTPVVNSIGGEWMILGLARSGKLTDDVAAKYYDNVVETVKQAKGVLDSRKYTEYSRVVLALTAADFDATNVAGYDLTAPLTDFDKTVWQGNNGTAFGLLALNSHGYRSDNTAIRQQYVNELLNKQLDNGGWYITSGSADPDMTAMAIQALAPYYATNDSVKTAVDKALAFLSENQGADGDYGSSETCAQVVVALSALGIDAAADSRFVKNGTSVLEALCSYYAEDATYGKGFAHVKESNGGYEGGAYNGMATEQGYYALTAYHRFKEAQTALYDMSDVCAGQHSYGDWTVTKAASCTENGSRSRTCSACGKTETEAITAPGHKLTKTAAKASTCTVGGNNEYFTCSVCGKVFKDSGGKQETTAAAETLPAIGHKWTNATCTAPKACRNCGLTEGTSVAHSYNEKGICSVCGGKNPVSNVNTENVKPSADNDKIVTDNSGLVVKSDAAVDDTQLSEITTALTGGSIAVKIDDSMTVAKADDGGVAALKEKADTLTDEQKTEVNNLVDAVQAMRTDSAKKNEQVEMVLDICAVLKNSSGTPVAELMELPEPIIVTIPVSDALYASLQGRKIAVLRSHTDAEGAVTTAELPAEWGGKVGNRYVKFASDRFSTFALISYETVSSGSGHSHSTVASGNSPETTDSGIALYAAMSVMSLMGMGWVGKRRSK